MIGADEHQGEPAEAVRLAGLLPPGVALAAAGAGSRLPLPASEAARAADLPRDRAREFTAGRWCAHRALERLGCPESAIGTGRGGEPCWPAGFTGSITHKSGLAVAVAAAEPQAIGIDLEHAAPLHPAVRRRVLLPAEPDLPPGFPVPAPVAERIAFSVKEAYYKWHTVAHGGTYRPGFADVRVRLEVAGRLLAEPTSGAPPAAGAWVCGPSWILAAVWAAAAAGRPALAAVPRPASGPARRPVVQPAGPWSSPPVSPCATPSRWPWSPSRQGCATSAAAGCGSGASHRVSGRAACR
jgi:4'-phosphopantetheinyl transferase EntD